MSLLSKNIAHLLQNVPWPCCVMKMKVTRKWVYTILIRDRSKKNYLHINVLSHKKENKALKSVTISLQWEKRHRSEMVAIWDTLYVWKDGFSSLTRSKSARINTFWCLKCIVAVSVMCTSNEIRVKWCLFYNHWVCDLSWGWNISRLFSEFGKMLPCVSFMDAMQYYVQKHVSH